MDWISQVAAAAAAAVLVVVVVVVVASDTCSIHMTVDFGSNRDLVGHS